MSKQSVVISTGKEEESSFFNSANLSSRLAVRIRSYPCMANSRAVARPIPLDKLLVDADGDIDLRFTGSADAAVYTLDGSGKVRGLDFQTSSTFLDMDGSTNAEIWATEKLDVKLDGKATVCVKGHPAIVSQVNGSGKILDCN